MKKLLSAAAIGLAVAVSAAGAVSAQPAAPTEATSGRPDFAGLLVALNGHATALANLAALTTVDPTMVTLVNSADMIGGANTTAYLDAMQTTDVAGVQAAIAANPVVANAVTSVGVDISDVIAINVTTAGAVTVYYLGDD